MFTSFSFLRRAVVIFGLSFLFACSLSAQGASGPNPSGQSTVLLNSPPELGCATVLSPGDMVLAERFFTTYEFAFRRVALLRAHGFVDAKLLHTDCQAVDVDGDFYIVTISPIAYDEQTLLGMMERYYDKGRDVGIKMLRVLRAQ